MKFTESLWQEITPVYEAILAHDFIQQLIDGSLPGEIFKFYLQQDALYLEDFSKALAITGTKAIQPQHHLQFLEFARGAIVTERALHESYFEEYGVRENATRSPACFGYTNFLLLTAYQQSYEISTAALLPCFWIYREVGNYIFQQSKQGNPYDRWIETYSGEEFGEAVEQAIDLTDMAARNVGQDQQESMKEHFVRSSQLEWMFWDSAYQLQQWEP
ncbi:MAG TPA: thiaminase II [bacterium]|nr:thiaminase II [bacterium]